MSIIIQTKCPNCSEYVDLETKETKYILRFFFQSKTQGGFRCAGCSFILDDEIAFTELSKSVHDLLGAK